MLNYLIRRVAYGVLILIGVNLFTFFLFFNVNTPDDMARLNIGGKRVTQEQIDKWKAERGYDKPLYWNAKEEGADKFEKTVLWERSISLFALDFGRSDSGRSVDIGHEIKTRMWVSVQLAVPVFVLQVIASTSFALLLIFFRHSRIDFWGVVVCVLMLSISSLFYIIVGQFFFSRLLHLVPISGYTGGIDAIKFLLMPIGLSLLARLGSEARLYVFLGSIVFESFFGIPGLGAFVIDAISGQDFAIVRSMVFLGAFLYIASYIVIDLLYTWADPRVRLA
jgi:peptide/nickel transport system permease protein